MKSNTLAKILSKHGHGTQEDSTIVIPDEQNVTLYASLGGEALMIADVKTIEIDDEMIMATTGKGDLFAIAAEDIRALRVGQQTSKMRTGLIRGS